MPEESAQPLSPEDQGLPPRLELAEFLPYRLAVAAAEVSQALARCYQAEFGLSIPEWRVLAHLSAAGSADVSIRDIETRARMEKSMASRAASRLEAAGYLVKLPSTADRRLLALSLTPAGEALMRRLVPEAQRFQAELMARLGPGAAALEAGLSALEAEPQSGARID